MANPISLREHFTTRFPEAHWMLSFFDETCPVCFVAYGEHIAGELAKSGNPRLDVEHALALLKICSRLLRANPERSEALEKVIPQLDAVVEEVHEFVTPPSKPLRWGS